MKDIIVFIPHDIACSAIGKEITDILHENHIQITNIIEQATLILDKKPTENDIKKYLEDEIAQLVLPLKLPEPILLLPDTKQKRQKHFIQRNIDIKRFNKIKQFNKQTIFNRYRHR